MWMTTLSSDEVRQFASAADAQTAADAWENAESRIHPSGIGWAVWINTAS